MICEGGASFKYALMPFVGGSTLLYIAVVLFLKCGSMKRDANLTMRAKKLKRKARLFGQIKIIISFLQIFSSLPNVLDSVPWPKIFLQLSFPLNLFNFDIATMFSFSSCSVSVRYFDQFILHMMMPLFCLFGVLSGFLTAKACTPKKNKARRIYITESVSKILILMTLLMFPGLSTKVFSMFKCQKIDGIEEGRLLVEDFSQFCNEGEHFIYSIISISFLFVYILGIPATMFMLLWCNKKHLHDEESLRHHYVETAFGGLYTQFEPQYWWFELVNLLNKTLMCGGLAMLAPGTSYQILFAVIIMLLHLLVVLKLAPYVKDTEDWSCIICTMSLMLTSLGAAVMKMRSNSSQIQAIGTILVVITLMTVTVCILINVMVDCGVLDRLRGKKQIDHTQVIPKAADYTHLPGWTAQDKTSAEAMDLKRVGLRHGAGSEEYMDARRKARSLRKKQTIVQTEKETLEL